MVVTGVDADDNLLVSSWSYKCSFDSNSIQERTNYGSYAAITSISYGIR